MNPPILPVSQPSYHYRHPASRESSPSMDVVFAADSVYDAIGVAGQLLPGTVSTTRLVDSRQTGVMQF